MKTGLATALVSVMAWGQIHAAPCLPQQLAAFLEAPVAGPINKCMSASEVRFRMPPTTDLTTEQIEKICDERQCKEMIAAVDDMEVPRCETLFNGKNMTVQANLDRFTAICDAPRSMIPIARKRTSGSSKGESMASYASKVTAAEDIVALIVISLGTLLLWA